MDYAMTKIKGGVIIGMTEETHPEVAETEKAEEPAPKKRTRKPKAEE